MRRRLLSTLICSGILLAGCGGGSSPFVSHPIVGLQSHTPKAGEKLGFPSLATKNTTRVGGGDPVADAAGVALAVYPSQGSGTHPQAVTIVPTDDWQGALAAASLAAPPLKAPILFSNGSSLPSASSDALATLAPTGAGAAGGAQVIRIGNAANPKGLKAVSISGKDPYTTAAEIDRFATAARGRATVNVMVASADDPTYAMPAAGLAAESGQPLLYVNSSGVPPATQQALQSHGRPHIYVVGPADTVPDSVVNDLRKLGTVKRVSGGNPVLNAIAFTEYRDPPCPKPQLCLHVPGSFGWAMTVPGHGYILVNSHRPLDAAAAAPLSASGSYGPILLVDSPSNLPRPLLSYFYNYAVPGYARYGPTQAFYDHVWLIGDESAISVPVQSQVDAAIEIRPVGGR